MDITFYLDTLTWCLSLSWWLRDLETKVNPIVIHPRREQAGYHQGKTNNILIMIGWWCVVRVDYNERSYGSTIWFNFVIIGKGQRKSSLNWVTALTAFRIALQSHLWMAFQSSNFWLYLCKRCHGPHLNWQLDEKVDIKPDDTNPRFWSSTPAINRIPPGRIGFSQTFPRMSLVTLLSGSFPLPNSATRVDAFTNNLRVLYLWD